MESSDNTTTVMSLPEARAKALAIHQEGKPAEARSIYEQILAVVPEDADTLHYLGLACYQLNDEESALKNIRAALEAAPDYLDARNNLGIICQALGHYEEAEDSYREVIRHNPEHANSHNNLGVVLKCQGKIVEAEACYRQALKLDPEHAQAHHNLGNLLRGEGFLADAIHHYQAAIDRGINVSEARHSLVNALYTNGQKDEARRALERWKLSEPDHPIVNHLLSAIGEIDSPNRASDGYVKAIFNEMATTFDEHLGGLEYQGHTLVIDALDDAVGPELTGLDILDAGCGTGLSSPFLRPRAATLVGIDLSSGMLRRARATGHYDELVECELTAYLQGESSRFDVIICADTLCYFGDIADVTRGAAGALKPGGYFIFTVERMEDARIEKGDQAADTSDARTGFQLSHHGRYQHSEDYLLDVLTRAGLELQAKTVEPLRKEVGKLVNGTVTTARRPISG